MLVCIEYRTSITWIYVHNRRGDRSGMIEGSRWREDRGGMIEGVRWGKQQDVHRIGIYAGFPLTYIWYDPHFRVQVNPVVRSQVSMNWHTKSNQQQSINGASVTSSLSCCSKHYKLGAARLARLARLASDRDSYYYCWVMRNTATSSSI